MLLIPNIRHTKSLCWPGNHEAGGEGSDSAAAGNGHVVSFCFMFVFHVAVAIFRLP